MSLPVLSLSSSTRMFFIALPTSDVLRRFGVVAAKEARLSTPKVLPVVPDNHVVKDIISHFSRRPVCAIYIVVNNVASNTKTIKLICWYIYIVYLQ